MLMVRVERVGKADASSPDASLLVEWVVLPDTSLLLELAVSVQGMQPITAYQLTRSPTTHSTQTPAWYGLPETLHAEVRVWSDSWASCGAARCPTLMITCQGAGRRPRWTFNLSGGMQAAKRHLPQMEREAREAASAHEQHQQYLDQHRAAGHDPEQVCLSSCAFALFS